MSREYTIHNSATHATAITILQLTAPSSASIEIIRVWVTQASSTTSAQTSIQILRKTVTAAGLTVLTPTQLTTGDTASGVTGGHTATGEGTDGEILHREGFNILNGCIYLPLPEERPTIPPGGMVAIKFPVSPASATYIYGITFQELV